MAEAEAEDNSLERVNAVVNEIEAHCQRLIRETKLARATPASIMQEISETVMPLLRDFAVGALGEVIAMRQYIHQYVEPALAQLGGDDSMLLPEDAELITERLLSFREMLEGLITRAVGEDKTKMEAELAEVDTVLARVAEITIDDDDPDGNPDGAGEGEGNGEGGDPAEAN